MKVIEKSSDRRAGAHIHVVGNVAELEEYGEYIDPIDKAICCYVPVEHGHEVKIRGHFSGTTLALAFDAVVDGVFRKAGSYVAKTVYPQKNKKLDIEAFLYKHENAIIDTAMHVVPITGVSTSKGDGTETIGTMELRLFITRQLGVSHVLGDIKTYDNTISNIEDKEVAEETVIYNRIAPDFQMTFEKNTAPLERHRLLREQRKIASRRPGTEPWAIFRFHYRSMDAITESNLTLTYDPRSRAKTEPRTLMLEPVPSLPVGAKPLKDDDDNSTRASSPAPTDVPFTPVKSAPVISTPKSPTLPRKPAPKPTTAKGSTTTMTSAAQKEAIASPDSSLSPDANKKGSEDLRARIFSQSTPKSPAPGAPTATIAKPTEKPVEDEQHTVKDTIIVAAPKGKSDGMTEDNTAKTSRLPQTALKPANETTTTGATPVKDVVKQAPQAPVSPTKQPVVKPVPVTNMISTVQIKPSSPVLPVTPTKRSAEPANGTTSELKRAKVVDPPTSKIVSRMPTGSTSPLPISIERQVAEQRKRLETLRQKRLETAKRQEQLDQQLAPYKQRMAEELDRLNKEMMEEEAAVAEAEERAKATAEMLAEFEKADGGN